MPQLSLKAVFCNKSHFHDVKNRLSGLMQNQNIGNPINKTPSSILVDYKDNLIIVPEIFSQQWLTVLLDRMTNTSQKELFTEQTKIITGAVLETMASLNNNKRCIFPNVIQGGSGCYAVAPGRVREETKGTFQIGIPVDEECKNILFVSKNKGVPIAIGHLLIPGNKKADWSSVKKTIANQYTINANNITLDLNYKKNLEISHIPAEMGRVSPLIQPVLYTGNLPYHVLIDPALKNRKIMNNAGNVFLGICTTTEEIVSILQGRKILISEGNFSKNMDMYSPDISMVLPEYEFARWSKEDGIVPL